MTLSVSTGVTTSGRSSPYEVELTDSNSEIKINVGPLKNKGILLLVQLESGFHLVY